MSAGAPPFTTSDTRIQITRRTARWDDREVTRRRRDGLLVVRRRSSQRGDAAGVAGGRPRRRREHRRPPAACCKHPWKRARTTLQYLAVAILGSPQDRAAFRAAVDRAHRQVTLHPDEPGDVQRLRPRPPDVGRGMPFRRPGGHLPTAARRDSRRRPAEQLLPLRFDPGHHAAGHRGPVARHPRRVRRLLELRVRARRHGRCGARLSAPT